MRRGFEVDGNWLASRRAVLTLKAVWSEALAVGNQQFVERVTGIYEARQKYVYTEASIATDLSTWTIREASLPCHFQG